MGKMWVGLGVGMVLVGQSPETEAFLAQAKAKHGALGARAATFLVSGMPEADRRVLKADFLMEHLDLALEARTRFPWAAAVPEAIFFNDVLPYASVDETREPWRRVLLPLAADLVKDCHTAAEAAQVLNRDLFKKVNVHYHTGRKKPNQSPAESMAQSRATCTGLSILLVNACRAVGIPARLAGTAQWARKAGNHTWVEVWDGRWAFTGADEHDPKGLDRGWFVEDASHAEAGHPTQAIYATSWAPTGQAFPMVWAAGDRTVPGVDVTARYRRDTQEAGARVFVRLRRKDGGERMVATVSLLTADGQVLGEGLTRAGTADLNDMPALPGRPEQALWLRVQAGRELREHPVRLPAQGDLTLDLTWDTLTPVARGLREVEAWKPGAPLPEPVLDRRGAARAAAILAAKLQLGAAPERTQELEARSLTVKGKTLRWMERSFGSAPAGSRSLWISLHGGGGAPAALNDQQWQNQIRLYEPTEGIYLAPRGPSNSWDLWHQPHLDPMFDRLIAHYVATRGVDPDKVYLLGYSAGGDGVYQLGPRMADRWAAAAMMAGHPNDSDPRSLRNLPFALFMGGQDSAYRRNEVVVEYGARLEALRQADPEGYRHWLKVYPESGHWMNGQDREALPWMQAFRREPWPRKVVWVQDDVTATRFYWLGNPEPRKGQVVAAEVQGQEIRVEAQDLSRLVLRLDDRLLDLDRPVTVRVDGKVHFQGRVKRSLAALHRSLQERMDPVTAAPVLLELDLRR